MRVAILRGTAPLPFDIAEHLRTQGVESVTIDRQEEVLRTLAVSPAAWDAVLYPISAQWQQGLEFVRAVRRVRECAGGQPGVPVLILSATSQHPTTVDLFKRTSGTRYAPFGSPDDLISTLESLRQENLKAKQEAARLHIRVVHAGNPAGIGCVPHERLLALYVSFQPGEERRLQESPSQVHFLNFLAMNHWKFRTASEITQAMRHSPFYAARSACARVVCVKSVKTYIRRCELALSTLWRQMVGIDEPPALIAREPRGGKQVAYRLMSTCEIDHV